VFTLTFQNITLGYEKVPRQPRTVVLDTDDGHAGNRNRSLCCGVTVGRTDTRAVTDDVTSVPQTLVCRQQKATPVVHMSPLTYGHTSHRASRGHVLSFLMYKLQKLDCDIEEWKPVFKLINPFNNIIQ
jgi:hypothetical protein